MRCRQLGFAEQWLEQVSSGGETLDESPIWKAGAPAGSILHDKTARSDSDSGSIQQVDEQPESEMVSPDREGSMVILCTIRQSLH